MYYVINISHARKVSSGLRGKNVRCQNSKNLLIPEVSWHHYTGDHEHPGAEEGGDHLQHQRVHQELLPAAGAPPAPAPPLHTAGGRGGLKLLHLGPGVPGPQPGVGLHGLHREAGETHPAHQAALLQLGSAFLARGHYTTEVGTINLVPFAVIGGETESTFNDATSLKK